MIRESLIILGLKKITIHCSVHICIRISYNIIDKLQRGMDWGGLIDIMGKFHWLINLRVRYESIIL